MLNIEELRKTYYEICELHDVVAGSPEAAYLWKEYIAEITTLDLLLEAEDTFKPSDI